MIPELSFATNRAAIGRIWTILWGSRRTPRGHILGPFWAPWGPKNGETNTKTRFFKILWFLQPRCKMFDLFYGRLGYTPPAPRILGNSPPSPRLMWADSPPHRRPGDPFRGQFLFSYEKKYRFYKEVAKQGFGKSRFSIYHPV